MTKPARMDCRAFRAQHLEFTEHALTVAAQAAAQGHLESCVRCARFDLVMRRGLLVARNLPPAGREVDLYPRIAERLAAEAAPAVATSGARRRTATALIAATTAAFAAGVMLSPKIVRTAPPAAADGAVPSSLAGIEPAASPPIQLRGDFAEVARSGMPPWSAATLLDEAPAQFAGVSIIAASASR